MTPGLRTWIRAHDDSTLFIVGYLTFAVVLSIWLGLFWLLVVVAFHFALELVCQHEQDTWGPGVVIRAIWEVKLDIGFVLAALVLAVYMDVIFGILGLGHAARAGVQGGARFAIWERVIRAVLLTADDALQVGRAAVAKMGNGGAEVEVEGPPPSIWGGWDADWSTGDRLSLGLSVVSLLLMVTAPFLTDHDPSRVVGILLEELHPFAQLLDDA